MNFSIFKSSRAARNLGTWPHPSTCAIRKELARGETTHSKVHKTSPAGKNLPWQVLKARAPDSVPRRELPGPPAAPPRPRPVRFVTCLKPENNGPRPAPPPPHGAAWGESLLRLGNQVEPRRADRVTTRIPQPAERGTWNTENPRLARHGFLQG